MIAAWRLTDERYADAAMSGNGGLFVQGRWHSKGRRIIYASSSLALATLDIFVNLQNKRRLSTFVKTRIAIPEAIIASIEPGDLRAFLEAPERFDSRALGDRWLAQARSCVLEVPKRVVPQETNYLVNPLHPDVERLVATSDRYLVDERLLH